jgi:hypothetical protein
MKALVFIALLATAALGVAPAQRRPISGPVATVAQLYRDFAWEAVVEEPSLDDYGLLNQPRSVLQRYFDDRLTDLWLADRACEAKSHEICRIDFLPIWSSQDPTASGLKIAQSADSNVVGVTFHTYQDRTVKLTYYLIRTPRGWRIDDIRNGSEWSLRQLLSRKL